MLLPGVRRQAVTKLRSPETLARAGRIIALKNAELRGAVLLLIAQMEDAVRAQDWPAVYDATHEIRGMAGTADLGATGRIANGLCHYLDAMTRLGHTPEAAVASLHLDAVLRSARTKDDTARHGDAVAQQLAELVARKLADIKISATA
jgi:hypothetical protein